jgi:hypothetical protein
MQASDLSPVRHRKPGSRWLWLRLLSSLLLLAQPGLQAAPSTFGNTFGNALLCRDSIDSVYFHDYLTASFGPAYKHEGGAYWFKADANLWGSAVSDALVSDNSSALAFVGAVFDATPEELVEGVAVASGVRHMPADQSAFPVRQANPGSKIVYFNTKSKMYCVRYQSPPPD